MKPSLSPDVSLETAIRECGITEFDVAAVVSADSSGLDFFLSDIYRLLRFPNLKRLSEACAIIDELEDGLVDPRYPPRFPFERQRIAESTAMIKELRGRVTRITKEVLEREPMSIHGIFDFRHSVPVNIDTIGGRKFAIDRNNNSLSRCFGEEGLMMAHIVSHPAQSKDVLARRQGTLDELTGYSGLSELETFKKKLEVLDEAFALLFKAPHYLMHGEETRLLDLFHYGRKEAYFETRGDFDNDAILLKIRPIIEEGIEKLVEGLKILKRYSEELKKIPGGIWAALSEELVGVNKMMQEALHPDKFTIKHAEKEHQHIVNLEATVFGVLFPYLDKLSAAIDLAILIKKEDWGRASFDEDRPEEYKGAWNIRGFKDRQTICDDKLEGSFRIFSGVNGSGKTFALAREFFIRMIAQSVGYGPFQHGNFHFKTGFGFVDRASTNDSEGRSAFVNDATRWEKVLAELGSRPCVCVDEGFSTAAHDDQAPLLIACSSMITKDGGSIIHANHNGDFMASAQGLGGQVLHFKTQIEHGKIESTYQTAPGIADARSLEIARQCGFPEDILATAERYLSLGDLAQLPEIKSGPAFAKIETYAPDERERMKRELVSAMNLFPDASPDARLVVYSDDTDFAIQSMLDRMILCAPRLSSQEILERQKTFEELSQTERANDLLTFVNSMRVFQANFDRIFELDRSYGLNNALNPLASPADNKEDDEAPKEATSDDKEFCYEIDSINEAIAFLKLNQKLLGQAFLQGDLLTELEILLEIGKCLVSRDIRIGESIEKGKEDAPLNDQELALSGSFALSTVNGFKRAVNLRMKKIEEIGKKSSFPRVPFLNTSWGDVSVELAVLGSADEAGQKVKSEHEVFLRTIHLPDLLRFIPQYETQFKELLVFLRSLDSVYTHQIANYLEKMGNDIMKGAPIEKATSTTTNVVRTISHLGKGKDPDLDRMLEAYGLLGAGKKGPFEDELDGLKSLSQFAEHIKRGSYCKVNFTDDGTFELIDATHKDRDRQSVPNSVSFDPAHPIKLFTGPYGSGKTTCEKRQIILPTATGLATGFTQAKSAKMPIFNSVIYLDRVTQPRSENLGAFTNEAGYWVEIFRLLQDGPTLACVDEGFSSVPHNYQGALGFASIGKFNANGSYLAMSSHHHELVDRLVTAGGSRISPQHFKFDLGENGITYHYQMVPGHAPSHAAMVARQVGLPEDIIKILEAKGV